LVPAHAGANQAEIQFGYAENGPPSSFFCAYRQETCLTTIPSAHPTDPYSFASEPSLGPTPCQSGCTINIPAIPSRTVYYRIVYLNSGQQLGSTPARAAMAAPQFQGSGGNGGLKN
jgi:hypothetical protein